MTHFAIQVQLAKPEARVKVLKSEADRTGTSMKALETEAEKAEARVNVLESQLSKAERRVNVLESQLSKSEGRVKLLEAQRAETDGGARFARAETAELKRLWLLPVSERGEAGLERAEWRLRDLEAQLEKMSGQEQENIVEMTKKEKKIKEAEDRIKVLEKRLENARGMEPKAEVASLPGSTYPLPDEWLDWVHDTATAAEKYLAEAPSGEERRDVAEVKLRVVEAQIAEMRGLTERLIAAEVRIEDLKQLRSRSDGCVQGTISMMTKESQKPELELVSLQSEVVAMQDVDDVVEVSVPLPKDA